MPATTTYEFPIVAVDTATPSDAGFTVKLDQPFDDYHHGSTDARLPSGDTVSHAIEDAASRGLVATQFAEREAVGTLVVDETGAYVCTCFEK